jgi:hypothetical protein
MSLWAAQVGILTPPAGGGGGGLTLTKVGEAAGVTSVTWPSVAAGDLAVCWNYSSSGSSEVVPTGFSKRYGAASGSIRCVMSHKLCTGSESGTLAGMVQGIGPTAPVMALVIFRGSAEVVLATPSPWNGQVTTGNPSAQLVAAAGQDNPLIVVAGYGATGAINPRLFSTTADGEVSPDSTCYLLWKIYNTAPADTTVDMDDEGSGNALSSGHISLTDIEPE